ncbi:uncharacterized protein LOC116263548 [Nymphaea colorata]|uniref:Uncharacterized protein n=1 Tax=Nymphaea colorata TaxID=210225 RepID=A0A5K0XQP7_9MAGN|nr:uncharacterized protein LOC116263548 [Nymphaea colorata]
MLRTLSLQRDGKRYYKLEEEEPMLGNPNTGSLGSPVRCRKATILFPGFRLLKSKFNRKPAAIHPLTRLSDASECKKMTKRPETARYLNYLKEAGRWEDSSDRPVMHFP